MIIPCFGTSGQTPRRGGTRRGARSGGRLCLRGRDWALQGLLHLELLGHDPAAGQEGAAQATGDE